MLILSTCSSSSCSWDTAETRHPCGALPSAGGGLGRLQAHAPAGCALFSSSRLPVEAQSDSSSLLTDSRGQTSASPSPGSSSSGWRWCYPACGDRLRSYFHNIRTHGISSRRSSGLRHLVLVGLFMSRDLSPQILHVALEGADEPQQALPLLLQAVDVGASVLQLSLQTVQLPSHRRPTQEETEDVTSEHRGQKTPPHKEVSISISGHSSPSHVEDLRILSSHFG